MLQKVLKVMHIPESDAKCTPRSFFFFKYNKQVSHLHREKAVDILE